MGIFGGLTSGSRAHKPTKKERKKELYKMRRWMKIEDREKMDERLEAMGRPSRREFRKMFKELMRDNTDSLSRREIKGKLTDGFKRLFKKD